MGRGRANTTKTHTHPESEQLTIKPISNRSESRQVPFYTRPIAIPNRRVDLGKVNHLFDILKKKLSPSNLQTTKNMNLQKAEHKSQNNIYEIHNVVKYQNSHSLHI